MPPAQMMPLVVDDSEEEDTLCRHRTQSAPLEGVADERGRGSGRGRGRGRGRGLVEAVQSEQGGGSTMADLGGVLAAPVQDEVGAVDAEKPLKNLKSITKGQRTTCYERFELENMSGPLHMASSVVSALVDQLSLERSQVQRSYGIWVSTRGGAVLASSTPDERKSRLLQRLGPLLAVVVAALGKAENDSVCQLQAEVREAVAFVKGVVVAHPTAAFGTAFEELALSLVHLMAHHWASKGSQVNTCEIELSTAIIKRQFKWETARFVLVAVYDALHEGILESLHNTRISAPTLPGPPFCDRILGSVVRKSLWSAWVHSNAIDREKATAADLPCELIADRSVHGGLSYPSRALYRLAWWLESAYVRVLTIDYISHHGGALPSAQLAWTLPHQAAPPPPPFIFGQPQELQLPQWETFEGRWLE
ncbi:hypothetical protein T492DRAFT_901982 [Pavlovales sp. CCMP2436]|nr:hypothetical protein T492DRAFT_901982 [Pavlovales sp. CCMP2436]